MSMKNYKLVPMDKSHIKEIAQIERECFSDPWSEAALEEELYNPLASFIVAQRPDGAVLGYAGLHVVMDEGYLDNIAVSSFLFNSFSSMFKLQCHNDSGSHEGRFRCRQELGGGKGMKNYKLVPSFASHRVTPMSWEREKSEMP